MLLIACSRLRRSPEGDCCVGEMRFAHSSHTTISLFARRGRHARPSSSRGCQEPPCAPLPLSSHNLTRLSHPTISLFARRGRHARPSSSRGCQRPPCAPLPLSSHNLTRLSHPTISLFARRGRHARPSSSRGCQRPPCAPLPLSYHNLTLVYRSRHARPSSSRGCVVWKRCAPRIFSTQHSLSFWRGAAARINSGDTISSFLYAGQIIKNGQAGQRNGSAGCGG